MSSTSPMAGVKALTFDCFGTCTDWRSTISRDLANAAKAALAADTSAIPDAVRDRAARTSWSSFAQEWRGTYYLYVMSVSRDPTTPLKSIDQHNLDSLRKLLTEHDLDGLFDEDEVQRLSRRWHFLDPWPDVPAGIRALNAMGLQTCTLSNGNVELLKDMAAHADFEWTHVFSADMFGTFKPNPRVYLGAAERLGLQPHECCMVATHLADLQGAKECGFRTIYTARPDEEAWPSGKVEEARDAGWVDIWVDEGEGANGELPEAVARLKVLRDA